MFTIVELGDQDVKEVYMLPELQQYRDRIDDLRAQVISLIRDLPAGALNWRPIEGRDEHVVNSLAVLATHVAGAEHFWVAEVIGGYPATRQRDAEFLKETDAADKLIARLEESGRETRAVVESMTPDDLNGSREAGGRTVPVRWALLHVIDHTALHLGHMQLTYQLWQGGQGYDAPRWHQRIPRPDKD